MNLTDYDYLRKFLLDSSGLSLDEQKQYLVEARLIPLVKTWGLTNISEIVMELRRNNSVLANAVTEAMTTNETSFFRDKTPFEEFKSLMMPQILAERATRRHLRIWVAAAATGQEPYTIAMLLRESFPELNGWKVEIIATDISPQVLERARSGIYSQFEVQRGLPIQLLIKYFDEVEEGWQVKEELRRSIDWRELNLLQDFSHLGRFDVVFCRNVLIYFQVDTKKIILDRMATMLPSDGFLMMGAAETVIGITETFGRVKEYRAAVYSPDNSGQPLGIRTDFDQLPTPAALLREATAKAPVAE
jgi:chemotaxis protein methyltransferase CheR